MAKQSALIPAPGEALTALDPIVLESLTHSQVKHLSWLAIFGEDTPAKARSGVSSTSLQNWKTDENYQLAKAWIGQNKIAFAQENLKGLLVKATEILDSLLDSPDETVQAKAVAMVLAVFKTPTQHNTTNVKVDGDFNFRDIQAARRLLDSGDVVEGDVVEVRSDGADEAGD